MSRLLGLLTALLLFLPLTSVAGEAEEKAIALVEKLGGKIKRDENSPRKPVVTVDLRGSKVSDAQLKELAALKDVEELNLSDTKVSNAGMEALANLKSLRTLDLSRTQVRDELFRPLMPLRSLKVLSVYETELSGGEISWLRKTHPGCEVQR